MSLEPMTIDALQHRLEKLERQNRTIKRAGAGALFCVVALSLIGWMHAFKQQTYEGRFFLKDEFGNLKGALLTDAQSGLGSFFIGTSQAERKSTEGEMAVKNTITTQPHINFGYRKDNAEPFITIFDRNGQVRVSIGIDGTGETQLELYDRKGGLIWKAK